MFYLNRSILSLAVMGFLATSGVQASSSSSSSTNELIADDVTPSSANALRQLPESNSLSLIPQLVREEILEFMREDPRGTLSLMEVSHGFRSLALNLQRRTSLMVPIAMRQHLLSVLIGGQTGDVALFIKDQRETFQQLNLAELRAAFESRYYNGTLSPETEHGKTYSAIRAPNFTLNSGLWDLTQKKLRLVTLNFPNIDGAKYLSLAKNQLKIPPVLGKLTNLDMLFLGSNELTIPPVVTGLTKLQALDLEDSQLTTSPVMTGMTALKGLKLQNNQLTKPPVLTGLTNLTYLNLSKNRLNTLPDLNGLTHLNSLIFNDNQLTVSPVVTELTQLIAIDLSNNKLSVAPLLAGLMNLDSVQLKHNQLTASPVFAGLTKLRLIDLEMNQIIAPPVVTGLMNLNWISLDGSLCWDHDFLKTLKDIHASCPPDKKLQLQACSVNAGGQKIYKTMIDLDKVS